MPSAEGKVYLTGAGPGDPGLLTLKALRALEGADVVLYDRLITAEILALAPDRAELVSAGKHEGEQDVVQTRVLEQMLAFARAGKTVVRLKGGDPFVFGRGGEEYQFLAEQGVEVEVIPGITSAIAGPAAAGIPVTHRGLASSFAVIAGRCGADPGRDWGRYAAVDTLVVLMGVADRVHVAESLIRAGRSADEPAAFVERATTAGQRTVLTTLGEIAAGLVEVDAPAVLVAGAVVALGSHEAASTACAVCC